ncbi:flavodoxin FldA [Candidatus Erwinia haradaeae]|uniref:Flavodoxin n=1 Tax=Candidatus Erwinia haradaeae TaxID=1922217 RepID=A0A803FT67_9GAMM|nr:flavodoxin FldA [Candidatus Erwinia haradaeae]VFP87684.1 Flavodoxin 1 [Candidatus Erwinia haradaeae]
MALVGIFFGSDTGNTENVAHMIQERLGTEIAQVFDIAGSSKEDLESFNILLLGIPTWYYGEPQCDWDDFFPTLSKIDFTGKIVGLFGCGDQLDYSEYFCDAMGVIRDIVVSNSAIMIGSWPSQGYVFEASKGMIDNNYFIGLVIDEDRQSDLTTDRVDRWVQQISSEINLQETVEKTFIELSE